MSLAMLRNNTHTHVHGLVTFWFELQGLYRMQRMSRCWRALPSLVLTAIQVTQLLGFLRSGRQQNPEKTRYNAYLYALSLEVPATFYWKLWLSLGTLLAPCRFGCFYGLFVCSFSFMQPV